MKNCWTFVAILGAIPMTCYGYTETFSGSGDSQIRACETARRAAEEPGQSILHGEIQSESNCECGPATKSMSGNFTYYHCLVEATFSRDVRSKDKKNETNPSNGGKEF